MADQKPPTTPNQRIAPTTTYQVEGGPDDYQYELRGADLVLIDKNNEEHVFLFVGNIMSLDGQVNMTFANGETLDSRGLFERAEMVEVEPYQEETVWDAIDEEDPEEETEGNTANPDGANDSAEQPAEQVAQASPIEDLKQQVLEAAQKQNTFTSNNTNDYERNENVSPTVNTNTGDKQNLSTQDTDEEETEEITPSLAPPHLELTEDTNSGSKLDFVTNHTTPHFEGTAEPGSEVILFINDAEVATTKATKDGDFTFILNNTYGEGTYSVYVTSAKYGLEAQSKAEELVIDTTPPTLPSIRLAAESDLGVDNADKLTSDNTPTLEGEYAPGDVSEVGTTLIIEARKDGFGNFSKIGTTTVQNDGTWAFTIPAGEALGDGTYEFRLAAVDVAGNRTPSDTTVLSDVVIDTQPPTLGPILTLDADTANPDIAGTDADFITGDNHFRLSGTAGNDATIKVYINGTEVGSTSPAGGAWNVGETDFDFGAFSDPGQADRLAQGSYTLEIKAVDDAGNESATIQRTLVIDTDVADPGISIEGMINPVGGYYYIGDDTPTFNLTGEAHSTGAFTVVNEDTGATVAMDTAIAWDASTSTGTFTPPANLDNGTYTATFQQTDAAGNTETATLQFKIDVDPPPSPFLNVEDTGPSQSPGTPITNTPALTVSFAAGAELENIHEVRVYLNGGNPPDLDSDDYFTANRQGSIWTLSPEYSPELQAALDTAHSGASTECNYTVVVVDRSGRTDKAAGESYEHTSFVYDTDAPVLDNTELVTDANDPDFDGVPGDYKVELTDAALTDADRAEVDTVGDTIYVVPVKPTFSGSCEAGTSVTIILGDDIDSDPKQTLYPSTDTWSFQFGNSASGDPFALTKDAMNKVTIISEDAAGNTSSEVVYIKVAGDPPAAPDVDLADTHNTGSDADDITRGLDDVTAADQNDDDGVVRLEGTAPGASYVVVSYVDASGTTRTLTTSAGSQRIPVQEGLWESPEVLLQDTSTTTHTGTDYTFTVVAYDAANQPSTATNYTATIDRSTTTATIDLESDSSGPATSHTLDYGSGLTGSTDDRTSLAVEGNTLTFSGDNAEDGSTVYLLHTYGGVTNKLDFAEYRDLVAETGDQTGSWSIDLNATDTRLANFTLDGAHTFVVRSVDKAGNAADSAPLTVTFDSTAPTMTDARLAGDDNSAIDERFIAANPELAALNATYAADTRTKVPNFTLTGPLDAEATDEADNVFVAVFRDDVQIGVADVTTDASGNAHWTYDFTSGIEAGNQGVFTFHAEATDRAGNKTVGGDITITVDRTLPTISRFELEDADDSFYDAANPADDLGSDTDNYTGTADLTLRGSSDPSAPVLLEYTLDGGTTYTALYAIPNGTSGDSGTHDGSAWTQDGAGNWTYTVNVNTLRANLGTTATETVTFRATASDSAGNEISQSFSVDVDRVAPTGTEIGLDSGSDSMDTIATALGEPPLGSTEDDRTNADTLHFTGKAETGARVEVYRVAPDSDYSEANPGTLLDVVTADATTGGWNYTHTFDTTPAGGVDADGDYEFVAVAVDKAGNRGAATTLEVYRDTVVEAATNLDVNAQSVTHGSLPANAGESAANPLITAGTYVVDGSGKTVLDKSHITLEGTLSGHDAASDPVAAYVYESGTLLGKATLAGSGWSFDVTSLADGATYAYTLRLEDSAGNTVDTAPLYVKIDASTTAPTLDLIDADDSAGNYFYADAADPSEGDTDDVTNTGANLGTPDAFTLEGTVAEAGSTVTLYVATRLDDGSFTAYKAITGSVAQPSGTGTAWSCTVPDADLDGDSTYRIKAVAQDPSGNVADQTIDIVVDTQGPSLLESHELWLDNDSGSQDLKTNGETLELHGRLTDTADRDIVLYIRQDDGDAHKVTDIDWTTGEWSFEYTPALHGTADSDPDVLPEGGYSFVLYAEDRAGNLTTYPDGDSFDVNIDRSLSVPTLTLADGADTFGGPGRVDADHDGTADGTEDDYTGYVTANGTNIHLDIAADQDATVDIYLKTQGSSTPFDPSDPENGYDLYKANLTYNSSTGKWDPLVFDASAPQYQGHTNEITLAVVADDGSQTEYSSYTFTLDDEAPRAVAGDAIGWEPANDTATHITTGTPVANATNDKSIVISGALVGDNQDDVTIEIFDSVKSALGDDFGARTSVGMATVNADGTWQFTNGTDLSPVDEAFHKYTARIEDKAGNVTEITLAEVLVDRSAPATPGLAMVGTEDTDYTDQAGGLTDAADGYYLENQGTAATLDDIYYNNDSTTPFLLSGLEATPGAVLSIVVDGGTPEQVVVSNLAGTSYSYTPPSALTNGDHTIEAYVTDAAGNVSPTSTINFVVDTQLPSITDVSLDAASNTGSADDAAAPVTKAESPQITGKSESEAAIKVELRDDRGTDATDDDLVYTASTIADADGNWSVTLPEAPATAVAEGTYDVTVTAIDKAGNTRVAEDATSFEVNRNVDIVTDSFEMVENAHTDTGFANDDQYTSQTSPSFSWQAREDVDVRLIFYKDGIATPVRIAEPSDAELTTSGGVTTWTPAALGLADGDYTVKAVFTDTEAGNKTNPDDNTVDFTIDTASTSLNAGLTTPADTGIEGDWVTNPALIPGAPDTVTFVGEAPSGTTPPTEVRVQVYSVGNDGSRTLLPPQGTTEAYVNTNDGGHWTYNVLTSDLTTGDNTLLFVSTDLAGNTTEIEHTLEIDTTLDAGNVILAANDTVDETANGGLNNSGTYSEDGDFIDNKTNDTTPRLTGTTEPNSTVDLWLGDPDAGGTRIAANIPTDADGNWYFDVNTDTRVDADGDDLRVADITLDGTAADRNGTAYTFTTRVTDQAGNVEDASDTIIIDTQAPDETAASVRISSDGVEAGGQVTYSDTGLDHTDGYTSDTRPTLTGAVPEGNTRVDVYVTYPGDTDPTLIGTTKSTASGAWSLEFPSSAMPLAGSPHGTDYALSIRTWDDAGNPSAYSATTTVTVDDGFADLDAGITGTQPALIRFGSAFDAANPEDAVFYDPSDHVLKTNITTPVFDVTMEPDCDTATLTIIRLDSNGAPVSSPVEDQDIFTIHLGPDHGAYPPEDGLWTGVQFETSLGADATINGNWRLTVSGTDKAGNQFEQTQDLEVNGTPPAFTVEIVEDQAGEPGMGLYAGDNIVNAGTVHLAGTFADDVDHNEIRRISIINSVDDSVVAVLEGDDINATTWEIQASTLPAGANTYSLYIKSEDNFGNEYWYPSAVEPLTYTVDLNAPVLNQESVDLVAADDSAGIFYATNADDSTQTSDLHIEFGGEENAKVALELGGAVLFTAMPPDPSDADGVYTYALGPVPPTALSETLPTGVTYNAATNRYTFATSTLADGDYTFTLRVTDLAGNEKTQNLDVTVDNDYLDASLTADLSSNSDGGIFGDNIVGHDDNLTNETRPELSGNAEPGSAVRVYLQRFDTKAAADADTAFAVGNADWYETTPHTEILVGDDESSWSWQAVQQTGANAGDDLADGYYKVIVVSEDKAGNQPTPQTFVFGKDTDAPSEPGDPDALTFHLQDKLEDPDRLNEGAGNAGEVQEGDNVNADGDPIWVTSNWMPTIGGVAEPGSRLTIVLRIDGDGDGDIDDPSAVYKQLTIDVTDPSGNWSFDFAGEETGAGRLADGIYTAEVACTDPAGNTTSMSPPPQFQISSIPPSPPTIRLHQDDDSYDSQTSNDGITNKNTGLTLTGTAEAGATVRLYRSSTVADTGDLVTDAYLAANLVVTLTADASGIWTYEIPTDDSEDAGDNPAVVDDGSYRYFVAGDYFNGNTYYSMQATNAEGQARINDDGSPILKQPEEIMDEEGAGTGEYTYPDYVLEVDTALADPSFKLGLILDTDTSHTEEERRSNSSRMDSGIDNDWRTVEEIDDGTYLGEADDFWQTPEELEDEGHADSTYNDWTVKTSGPTIEGTVEAGSIVYVDRMMLADLTDDGDDNPIEQWVQVGVVEQDSTAEGTWRFVFPAEYENAQYDVRIRVVDKAGNEFVGTTANGGRHTITIDAAIKDTVFDLPDAQDSELLWDGVAVGTAWASITDGANLVLTESDGSTRVLDYVEKGHLPTGFESGGGDDLTTENNLLLSGEVEAGSRMYVTDTRQGVTVPITPVLIVDPAEALNDTSATEAYYVQIDDTGNVGTWEWKSAASFLADHGADYDGVYFHINADGTWQYRTGELADVKHAYTIENIDQAGNRAVTTPLAVTIDHEFADAAIGLSQSSDNGPFGDDDPAYDDRITNDSTPSLRLYGESGSTYLLYAYHVNADGTVGDNVNADGNPIRTGVHANGTDTWVTLDLADGGYQLRLVNVSESGHVREAVYPPTEADGSYVTDDGWDLRGSTHPLVIDTDIPDIPTQAAIDANTARTGDYHAHVMDGDPGDPDNDWTTPVTMSNGQPLPIIVSGDAFDVKGDGVVSDLITNDSMPTIQVFVEPGTMIAVSGMGYSSYLTDTDSDGIITLDPSNARNDGNPYTDGTYDFTVRFGDIAGNVNPTTANFSVTIDTSGPGAGIDLDSSSDTGSFSVDNLTNDTTPTITGSVGEDAVAYEITIGGTTIERSLGDADFGTLVDGHYEWTYTPTLENGEYSVSTRAWDRAGNISGSSLSAHHPDNPGTVTNGVPLIVHNTGTLDLYAGCESNRSGSRIYLDIDFSTSDAYNNSDNVYAGPNKLVFTYHYKDAGTPASTETVEMTLGETDFSMSLRNDGQYSKIEFQLIDSAGNQSDVGWADIESGLNADEVYTVHNVTGNLSNIPDPTPDPGPDPVVETTDVAVDLSGTLSDDNGTDSVDVSDVQSIRATITGDIDGDGDTESQSVITAVADDHSWSLDFRQELAAGNFELDLSALRADGSEVDLASDNDLTYDFSVLTEQMAIDQGESSQVLFDAETENNESAPPGEPTPGTPDCVTVDVDPVVVEEHAL